MEEILHQLVDGLSHYNIYYNPIIWYYLQWFTITSSYPAWCRISQPCAVSYGGFLKLGYPQSSSILQGCSITNHPAMGVSPWLRTPHFDQTLGARPRVPRACSSRPFGSPSPTACEEARRGHISVKTSWWLSSTPWNNMGDPQNEWFVWENPIQMDDLGFPWFSPILETSMCFSLGDMIHQTWLCFYITNVGNHQPAKAFAWSHQGQRLPANVASHAKHTTNLAEFVVNQCTTKNVQQS